MWAPREYQPLTAIVYSVMFSPPCILLCYSLPLAWLREHRCRRTRAGAQGSGRGQ